MQSTLLRVIGSLALLVLLAVGCSSEGDDVVRTDERWETRGSLLAWDGEVWIVDDQPLVVPATLDVDDQRVLGAAIDASGVIDPSGRLVTETITISEGEWPDSSLPAETIEGTIDRVDDRSGVWTIGNDTVVVPSGVRVHDAADLSAFAPGDSVAIAGHRLDDDRVIALDISMTGTSSSGDDDESDAQSTAPLDPVVFTTPSTDDDGDDNDKPGNDKKDDKDKDKDKDRD